MEAVGWNKNSVSKKSASGYSASAVIVILGRSRPTIGRSQPYIHRRRALAAAHRILALWGGPPRQLGGRHGPQTATYGGLHALVTLCDGSVVGQHHHTGAFGQR